MKVNAGEERKTLHAKKAIAKIDNEIEVLRRKQNEERSYHSYTSAGLKLIRSMDNGSFITYGMQLLLKKREDTYNRLYGIKVKSKPRSRAVKAK